MRMWYYASGGQSAGPVSEDDLRALISSGRVGPTDYIWTEGMANWVAVGQIFPPSGQPALPLNLPTQAMVAVPPVSGTGGQTPNGVLTAQARACLAGRWGQPIGFCLLMGLIQSAAGGFPVGLIVGGPLAVGVCIYFLTFTRGGRCDLDMLFAGFKNFGNALGAYLLVGLFVFLWCLLLIVPGIVAGLAYSQTLFLLADDRTLGPREAIRKSKQMMQGHKWRLACLQCRFFGWGLLCLLTCGIGFLWLVPYYNAAMARFYDDLKPPVQPHAQASQAVQVV